MSRTPAGRKDGGIKLLDINEQPLGYAQAKKRKRMQGHCRHATISVQQLSGDASATSFSSFRFHLKFCAVGQELLINHLNIVFSEMHLTETNCTNKQVL
jgi:hypothetical protein